MDKIPPGQISEGDQLPTSETDRGFATTLAKGLAILECFQPGDAGLGNTQLAHRTGLSRPTAARLSSTLADLGYLKYDAERAKYRLGMRTLCLAWPMLADMRIRQVARPLMQEFAQRVHGSVSLSVLDGMSAVYIESARGVYIGPHFPDIGSSRPILRTAIGRALATLLTDEERAALAVSLTTETPELWQEYGARYSNGIAQCMDQGLCVSEGDLVPGIHAVAVPLYRVPYTGDCFALNCGVAAFRLKPNEMIGEIGPRLVSLAETLRAVVPDPGD